MSHRVEVPVTTEVSAPFVVPDPVPRIGDRAALRIIQLGTVAIVIAVAVLHFFELDRFFVPKELVLHLTAAAAGVACFRGLREAGRGRIEMMLLGFVLVSILSALVATNIWLAGRAIAISASGFLLFLVARRLRVAGLTSSVINALSFGVVLVISGSLLQTYGIDIDLFSRNRAPGGTLGNRNFVAHVAAFGMPLLVYSSFRAASVVRYLLPASAAALTVAVLVLTRSRAAWLAFGCVVVVIVFAMLVSPHLRTARNGRRFVGIIVLSGASVVAALLIPNTLQWRSDNPYLETVQRVADYQEGSGRGRLIQYEHSLRMALRNPLLGAGPGNWAVEYPDHAARNDPSMSDNDEGMTTNPWPSSDWVAYVAERGAVATLLLMIALLLIALRAARGLRRALRPDDAIASMTLLGILAGVITTGLFDAVLLLALPTFFAWTALGALLLDDAGEKHSPALFALLLLLLALAGATRSGAQLTAMQMFVNGGSRAELLRAAAIDPSNYRIRLRLARMGSKRDRCEHALAARALYPNAAAAQNASRGCDSIGAKKSEILGGDGRS